MSYTRNLASSISKRNRAEEHRDSLKKRVDPDWLFDDDLVPLRSEFDSETESHILYAESLPRQLLASSSVMIGDCVQNLRACLDHLVWQLALEMRDGRTPEDANGVQFPIEFSRERFETARVLSQIDPRYHAVLDGLQPYKGGHGKRLAVLKQLTNDDKHRSLTVLKLLNYEFRLHTVMADQIDFTHAVSPLQVDAEVMRVKLSSSFSQEDMEVEGVVFPQVTLEDGRDAVVVLDELIKTVRFTLNTVGTL